MNTNPKYNVILLIEDSISPKIWKQEVEILKEKFNNNNKFNTIKNYTFKTEDKKLVIEKTTIDSIISSNKNTENNLVFVLSDTCSKIWRNNEVYNLLNELQNNSLVSIINLLPKSMWRGLAIETSTEIKTNLHIGTQNNIQIERQLPLPWYLEQEDLDILLLFPMTNIDEADNLINTIVNGGKVSNAGFYKNIDDLELINNPIIKETTASEKVSLFRSKTYQEGCSLAAYFSIVDSFTISDVDFVRKHMLPKSDKSVIAQLFLGGILDKAEPIENSNTLEYEEHTIINKDTPQAYSLSISYSGPRSTPLKPEDIEQRYKLKEGLSEELRKSLRYSEEHAIKVLMQEKKRQDFNKEYEFENQEIKKLKV